jgi:hypothetical protein
LHLHLVNTYPGRPGFSTASPTVVVPTVVFSNLPDATYTSLANNDTGLPLANGTRADCNWYINGDDYQDDWSGSVYISNCNALAAVYSVSLAELGSWNPSLGNTSLSSCSFDPGRQYCARWYLRAGGLPVEPVPIMPIRVSENMSTRLSYHTIYGSADLIPLRMAQHQTAPSTFRSVNA